MHRIRRASQSCDRNLTSGPFPRALEERTRMSVLIALFIFSAGFFGGAVNAIAGGGTFLTFGALTIIGIPPIIANTTSSLTQLPGYVASAWAYGKEISKIWRQALLLAVASIIGATLGATILLAMESSSFRALVPWLLLAATVLFGAGPWLKPKPGTRSGGRRRSAVPALLTQLATSIYGGFFGAGMGVMMLATLGLTQEGDYHRLNALKNLLSVIIAAIAIAIFVAGGAIAWLHALIMFPAVALGGFAGVWVAKRLPETVVRATVVVIGLLLTAYYLWLE